MKWRRITSSACEKTRTWFCGRCATTTIDPSRRLPGISPGSARRMASRKNGGCNGPSRRSKATSSSLKNARGPVDAHREGKAYARRRQPMNESQRRDRRKGCRNRSKMAVASAAIAAFRSSAVAPPSLRRLLRLLRQARTRLKPTFCGVAHTLRWGSLDPIIVARSSLFLS